MVVGLVLMWDRQDVGFGCCWCGSWWWWQLFLGNFGSDKLVCGRVFVVVGGGWVLEEERKLRGCDTAVRVGYARIGHCVHENGVWWSAWRWGQATEVSVHVVVRVWRWSIVILVKRAVRFVVKSNAWYDFALTVGLMHVCLITKISLETEFWKLKIPKMCFQFP